MRSPSKESPLPSESFPSYRQSSPTPTGSNFSKSEPAISVSTLRILSSGNRSVFDSPPIPQTIHDTVDPFGWTVPKGFRLPVHGWGKSGTGHKL